MATNKKPHNIHLLNTNLLRSEIREIGFLSKDDITIDDCITYIVAQNNSYKKQKLIQDEIDGVKIQLYYAGIPGRESALSKFAKGFVQENQNIVIDTGLLQSSILFLILDERLYCVPTGQGFRMISKYIIDKFGLVVLTAINTEFKVTAVNSNNMSGKAHSENKIFRRELDFLDVQDVDAIIKELKGRINNKQFICDLLELPEDTKKDKLSLIAKDGLQLSHSMGIEELIKILKKLNNFVDDDNVNKFIDIKLLDKNKNREEIEKNNNEVYIKLIKVIENKTETYLGYDFFSKDVDAFLVYDRYGVRYGDECEEFDDSYDILPALRKLYDRLEINKKDIEHKIEFIKYLSVFGVDNDDYEVSFGTLMENLSGEVNQEDKKYLMWYGNYYYVKDTYFDRLNDLLRQKISIKTFDDTLIEWLSEEKEDSYNSRLAKSLGASLIHKCIPDNIEFADVLQFTDENICNIYHVKDSFNCSLRELDRQVELSMKKLNDFRFGKEDYFKSLYQRSQNQNIRDDKNELYKGFANEDEFLKKLKIVKQFVFKVVINIDSVDSIINSDSNIAKYCFNHILTLSSENNYEVEICLVKKA